MDPCNQGLGMLPRSFLRSMQQPILLRLLRRSCSEQLHTLLER